MRNPFSAGSWVSGNQFYGRKNLIDNLLQSNEHCDWVLAQRRMGKTSLLRRLEERVNLDHTHSTFGSGLAIFWDIQGSYDISGLIESLEDAMDDSFDMFPESWREMDPEEFHAEQPHQMVKALARRLRRNGLSLTLLIDEAEEFITLSDKNPEALSRLRKVFHTSSNLHTIICSTPRLSKLMQHNNLETSPFLHGFHSHFLGPFSREETLQLLDSGHISTATGTQIFEKTLGNPYQVQLFAKYFFEQKDFLETDYFMQSNPSLAQVHEVNFGLLNKPEKEILTKVKVSKNPFQPDHSESIDLQKLFHLGYVQKNEGTFAIASFFFENWLGRHLNLHMDLHPKDEADSFLCEAGSKRIRENIVNLYQYLLKCLQEGKRLNIEPDFFKISRFDSSVYPVHDESSFGNIQTSTTVPLWHLAIADLLEIFNKMIQFDHIWSCFRLNELAENLADCEESDILDLMMLIREEARLENEASPSSALPTSR